jgi:nitrite reductase/ring-hydroxylating ferredoxin subunit
MAEVEVTTIKAVREGEARGFVAAGREIVLCSVEGEIYALDGICTHEAYPLDGGEVDGTTLTCEWHGATFDVCTGRATGLPATRALKVYATRVDDEGRVFVDIP